MKKLKLPAALLLIGAMLLSFALTANATDGAPCGACRQVMGEFAESLSKTEVILASLNGDYIIETVASLMPYPFVNFKPQED